MLDLAGPVQAFHEVNALRKSYRVRFCATTDRVRTAQGLLLADLEPLPEPSPDAMILVPGMPYRATERLEHSAVRWLKASAEAGAPIASVCTGAFVLGAAGVLDGKRCTTHWSRVTELQRRFPKAKVLTNRLYVTDGNVTSSAGIASGIDMALSLIEQKHGPIITANVAREMVVYLRRDGSHDQESIFLDYRTHLHPGIHQVQDFLVHNPAGKFTLRELGVLANMSPRNLTRVFRHTTGISVKEFSTRVRLELARTLLHDPALSLDAVARRCGFETARQFRRVWRDAYGAAPSETRATSTPLPALRD